MYFIVSLNPELCHLCPSNPYHYLAQTIKQIEAGDIMHFDIKSIYSNKPYNNVTTKNNNTSPAAIFKKTSAVTNRPTAVNNSATPTQIVSNNTRPATKKEQYPLYLTGSYLNAGRLGNQMFVYASSMGVALAQGRQMFVYPGSKLERIFKLRRVANITVKDWIHITPPNEVFFDPKIMNLPLKNITVGSLLQSFVYFSNITNIIRKEFIFRDEIAKAAAAIVSGVRAKYPKSLLVGVHVRRGDFLKYSSRRGYGVPQKSYFEKAFDWMRSSFPGRNVTFVVASDDLMWCTNNLKDNSVFVLPSGTPEVHMAVLASCDHSIISGGSYGWWSGWLSGGKVIYYKKHLAPGTDLGNKVKPEFYYPQLWIGMND